ncbi:MAG: RNA methyltransferase [Chitinophagaceae bacterium]|jgi:tRNA (guanosine-2'-O-)-methyltransferase|nr:RNA methyltransferase [Chitinophagaceae bacterium]
MTSERYNKLLKALRHRRSDLTVVMENVQDPHNISAVMRTCDAVGIQDIYILNTKIPRHKKWGARSSSSAAKWLSVHQFGNTQECFDALRKNYHKILATSLSAQAVSLHEIDFTESIALVFGNEHEGVTAETLALCDGNFIVPQVGIIQSLNISVACAISIYEAFRQKNVAGQYSTPSLSPEKINDLMQEWSAP